MKSPGEGIVRIAEEEKAEMIVMGTRGVGKVNLFVSITKKKRKTEINPGRRQLFWDPMKNSFLSARQRNLSLRAHMDTILQVCNPSHSYIPNDELIEFLEVKLKP